MSQPAFTLFNYTIIKKVKWLLALGDKRCLTGALLGKTHQPDVHNLPRQVSQHKAHNISLST